MFKKAALILTAFLAMAAVPLLTDPIRADAASVKTVNVLNYGADGDDTADDTIAFQKALNTAYGSDEAVKVVVPRGRYYIGAPEGLTERSLKIFSNTTLELEEGAIIMRSYDSPDVYLFTTRGYENITIRGGTLSANVRATDTARGIMSLCDVKGLTISDVNFISFCGTHAVLIDGAQDLLVERCSFNGFRPFTGTADQFRAQTNSTSYWSSEALHIDFDFDNGIPMRNVTVRDCTFDGCPSAVGTHHVYTGFTGENIKIINNTFTNCYYSGCNATNFNNFEFSGNVGINTPMLLYSANVRGKICDNISDNSAYEPSDYVRGFIYNFGVNYLDLNTLPAITICNLKDKNTGIINMTNSADVEVYNNTVSVNNYMKSDDPKVCAVKVYNKARADIHDNTVTNAPFRGIYADSSSVRIAGNTVYGCKEGVRASGCSDLCIENNTIFNTKDTAVSVYSCTGKGVLSNDISVASDGIFMENCGGMDITGNSVASCEGKAVGIFGSQVCNLAKNDLVKSQDGIYLGNGSRAENVSRNLMFSNASSDMAVCDGSLCALVSENVSDRNNVYTDDEETEIPECSVCEHKFTSAASSAATCTAAGYTVKRCQKCGLYFKGSIKAPKLHKFTESVTAPTYFAKGYTTHYCTGCRRTYTDSFSQERMIGNVSGMKSLAVSANAVKFTWDEVSGAQGYAVYVYNKSTLKWERYTTTTTNVALVSGLNPGESYAFTVRAFRKLGTLTVISPSFRNFKVSTKPAKVDFSVKSQKAGTADISWKKVSGATSYAVYYKTKTSKWVKLAVVNNKTTTYTKTKLKEGGQYYFTVRAFKTYEGVTQGSTFDTKGVKVMTAAEQKALELAAAEKAKKTAEKKK